MRIIFVDLQDEVVDAWQRFFSNEENVVVAQDSIFELECDALVSPANSFGFMDGGLDLRISEFFGWHVQERLQHLIQVKHRGELLVGLAEIIPTDHSSIPYVISAPTMRVPMILRRETVNIYLATRPVLLLIKYGTFENGIPISDKVGTVAIPGMGTGVGKVPPDICARQMKHAFDDVECEFQFPTTWAEAQKRHQLLFSEKYRDLQI